MFTAKIEGLRLLKDGTASVMLTCSGADLQAIANLRQDSITCYGENEKPVTDDRVTILARIKESLSSIAEQINRELVAECNNEINEYDNRLQYIGDRCPDDRLPYNEPYKDLIEKEVNE